MTLQDFFISNTQMGEQWLYGRNCEAPASISTRSRTKAWWRCDQGHEWQAAIDSRVHLGRGCPYCAGQMVRSGENDLLTRNPEIASLWHPARNGGVQPEDIMPGSRKRIWWQCQRGHEWQAPAYSLKAGFGCPYCSGRNAIPGETDLATTHPDLLNQWSVRNTLKPEQVTAGSGKKAWWRCQRDHEWEAVISSVATEGCGCPYCAGKLAIPGETDLETLYPGLMDQWDRERNGKLMPSALLPSSHEKVWWRCELGHSYQAAVFSRTREKPTGCPYCAGRKVLRGFNDLATLKPKLAEEWYQPLNGTLKPEDVTLGSNKKVWWQCSDGHVWQAFIYARAKRNGTGCPVCAGTVKRRRSTVLEVEKPLRKVSAKKQRVLQRDTSA